MNTMKITAALLAAGGALGVSATTAGATTVDLNISGLSAPTDITLIPGSSPQFNYGLQSYDDTKSKSFFTPENGALVGQLSGTYTPPGSDTTYDTKAVQTGKLKSIGPASDTFRTTFDPSVGVYTPSYEDAYANLEFSVDGTTYLGTAHFSGGDATLDSITFDPSGAPEPQSWALLIAGVGLAGAAMRRKAQPLATA